MIADTCAVACQYTKVIAEIRAGSISRITPAAYSISSRETSRWVQARMTWVPITVTKMLRERRNAATSAAVPTDGSIFTHTRLVMTGPDSRANPSAESNAAASTCGVFVVLAQAGDVVIQRVKRGGGEDAGLTHSSAKKLAQAARATDRFGCAGEG